MADTVQIDKSTFQTRLGNFIAAWKADKRGDVFNSANSIVIITGKSDESLGFQKNNAFQVWLLGYEFPATLMVLTQDALHIVTTKKKAAYLEPLTDGKIPVQLHVRGKDPEENKKQFDFCLDLMKNAGNKVGVITKDVAAGPFVDEWKAAYEPYSKDLEEVDMSLALSSAALAPKDEKELRTIRDASKASCALMTDFFVDQMSEILDANKKVTHKSLAAMVSNKIDDTNFFKKIKVSAPIDVSSLDWAATPTIQSGGKYDLKFSSSADDENLHAGTIVAQFGLRYQTYCSMIARTYLVDPNKAQESIYKLLLQVHEAVLKEVKDGVMARDVYNKAIAIIKAKKPDLEKKFVRNIGWGIGIEARDNTLVLNAKSTRVLRDGMTLAITTGFQDLQHPDPRDKRSNVYSMVLQDTVRVMPPPQSAVNFTQDAATDLESTSFFFKDEEEEEREQQKQSKSKKDSRIGAVARANITEKRLRNDRTTNQNAEKEAARRQHQKELHARKLKEGQERFKEGTGNLNGTAEKKFKRFESYKRDNQFPPQVKDLGIVVDAKSSTVIVPIMGHPVPFHINTIKNASRTDEAEYAFLRINFLSPGQGVGRKDDQPFEDPQAHFVRSLTFRSKEFDRMEHIVTQINELKKMSVRKENEKKEMEDVVEQDRLKEIRNRRPYILNNVYIRPGLEGKRLAGEVAIHENGLRYNHPGGAKVDVLFSNVKHLFFQPCQHELVVIIHVHLINPIIVGKRKTKDIQFLREATDMQFDETGNRKRKHRYNDEDEFAAEQEERRRRHALDKEFKNFAERISDAGKGDNLQVDVPFRELSFNGVPARTSVYVAPTTDCLVQLTEPPFLVITLSEVEVVHLERVQFGLKNFDMVIVFKDFSRPPAHINTIPMDSIDAVKDWLDSVEIPFSEGPVNLNWGTIMKTVTADPHAFFADGGWAFIADETDSEEEQEEDEGESDFEMSEEAFGSEESSEEESDYDEGASDEDSDEGGTDEDEEGDDWDELERKAKKKDQVSGLNDDEEKPKSRKKR